jgi:hypothetical protein
MFCLVPPYNRYCERYGLSWEVHSPNGKRMEAAVHYRQPRIKG